MKFNLIFLFYFICSSAIAHLERKLAIESQTVDLIFHAPRHINLLTVEPLDKKSLHFAIMHTVGPIDGGIQNLYGLDNGANIQFSFEYSLNEKFSLGAARSGRDKFYNLYGRYHLLKQTYDNKVPFSLSVMGASGINISDYSFLIEGSQNFAERSSFAGQLMLARKFSSGFSAQISPLVAYFIDPRDIYFLEGEQNLYLALDLSAKYKVTSKTSLTFQYIPNLNNELRNNLGNGIDMEAGGHVFQVYFVTNQELSEQYLLAAGNEIPWEAFKIGFNVNRVFAKK